MLLLCMKQYKTDYTGTASKRCYFCVKLVLYSKTDVCSNLEGNYMVKELKVNKYSQLEIRNLLKNTNLSNLSQEELAIVDGYIQKPILTYKNMSPISRILNIDLDELLGKKTISTKVLNFRNKNSEVKEEKLATILEFMVVANNQIELCEG